MRATASGLTMREAMVQFGLDPDHIGAAARTRRELHAYVELHIEQGPVLEQQNLPVGVVTAIAGATRLAANLTGMAGHAGTVPMAMRRDALAGAAECIVAVEEFCKADSAGLVGTVGAVTALPGATNVIPGKVSFTLDIRAPTDAHRKLAVADIVRRIEAIAKRRDLSLQIDVTHENRTVPCAPWLKTQVAEAVAAEGYGVFELPSGAGHDGMAMIDIADVAMLFVRCRGGISHNPAEHVEPADADAGARVLLRLIENFRPREARTAGKRWGRRSYWLAAEPCSSAETATRIYDKVDDSSPCSGGETNQSCLGYQRMTLEALGHRSSKPMNSHISFPSHREYRFYQGSVCELYRQRYSGRQFSQ